MCSRKRRNSSRSVAPSRPPKRQKQEQSKTSHTEKAIIIPKCLESKITDMGKDLFELRFPIASLNGLQRLAWGLDLRAEFVKVFLKFPDGKQSDFVLFCVHSSTDDEERELRHRFHSSKEDDPNGPNMSPCSPRLTILTCVLSRNIWLLTGLRQCRDLATMYAKVWKTIKEDPTDRCLICQEDLKPEGGPPVKLYTPTACAGTCMKSLNAWPLRARLSHLLSDVKALDFLLCSIYTAVDGQKQVPNLYGTDDALLVGCPLELDRIQPTIDSFPKLSDKLNINRLLATSSGKLRHARRKLLSWLASRTQGCLISLKPGTEYSIGGKSLEMCHQFLFLNSVVKRQTEFAKEIQKVGVGSVAFHGCRSARTFNILTDALRDMQGKAYVSTATGIYFTSRPSYSFMYATRDLPFRGWKNSVFSGQSWAVVYGLEVAMSDIPFRDTPKSPKYSTSDEGKVMIRYVFLMPIQGGLSTPWGAPADIDTGIEQDVMKKAFKALNERRLNPRHIGLDVDESGWRNGDRA